MNVALSIQREEGGQSCGQLHGNEDGYWGSCFTPPTGGIYALTCSLSDKYLLSTSAVLTAGSYWKISYLVTEGDSLHFPGNIPGSPQDTKPMFQEPQVGLCGTALMHTSLEVFQSPNCLSLPRGGTCMWPGARADFRRRFWPRAHAPGRQWGH